MTRKKKNKSEWRMEIYHFKVYTFRRTLELRIWWDEEWYKEVFKDSPYEDDYNLTSWFYTFNEEYNCNIIRLKELNIYTLVHELIHCVIWMCEQCWLPVEWEPPAFIYEELFAQIWYKLGDRFKWDKKTEKYF